MPSVGQAVPSQALNICQATNVAAALMRSASCKMQKSTQQNEICAHSRFSRLSVYVCVCACTPLHSQAHVCVK